MPNLKLITATDTQYSTAVLKSMNDQRNHGLFCDVTIIIQDKKFRAHKTILSASSTYFHQLFSVAGQVIELNFIKAEIFEQILNYIYSSKIIRVRSDMLEELIGAGQILGIKFIANLGQLLSQVKGLPGLSKDAESKSGASAKVMPIITESFSISAEEFNQTCKSGEDDDGDSDNDVMFVSETETAKATARSPPAVIDLDGGAWDDAAANDKPERPSAAGAGGPPPDPEDAAVAAMLKTSPQVTPVTRPALSPHANADSGTGASIPSSPVRMSSALTPTTPSRPPHSLTPLSPNTPQSCDGSDMMGVQKKQVCTTAQQGDFKIRLSDMSSSPSSGRDGGPNFPAAPPGAVVAKKTITLDKALEFDALSSGCKVYANIGENTYDIVPVKEDPDEGGSKLAKGKRALMATPLRPYDKSAAPPPPSPSPPSPGASGKKKIKSELEDHYELIMDGKTFYVCMVCKRPYVCLTSLRRHFNTHSWEKKYPCRYCNKVFALAEYRTKHEAHHTGERRYQCLLCNEMFLNYQVLSTHCKQAHNQDPSGRKEKDDTPNNLYRLLPYKSHPAPPPPPPWPGAHEGGIRMIGEDGSVQHIMPGGGGIGGGGGGGEEVQSSTQSKILNWNDIFVEPDARSRGPGAVMNPQQQQQQQQANPEFDFVIPETY